MSFKWLSRSVASIMAVGMAGLGAQAQVPTLEEPACPVTELSASKATDLYLKAETELIANDNPEAALVLLNQMRALELNCLEEGIALSLSAGIKIETGDFVGAIQDLETSLEAGYIPPDRQTQTLLNLGQLNLQADRKGEALKYLNRWIAAGGQPTRDQKWTMAVINQQEDNIPESLRWAEAVFADDGPGAGRQVYDFLIFLYDKTGNKAKKAQLLEQLLVREPNDRTIWDAIAGDYFQAEEERKAFEVQKTMYLGGILQTEDELMRVVNFYNRFNAPYEAARILEKEINAGRVSRTFERLELLANLYQVAREHEKAIPVIRAAAEQTNSASMYERLGRSYADLQQWDNAEEALLTALNIGSGLKDRGLAWVLIGQSRYERKDRPGAREAFRSANNRGGRGWLSFMRSEDLTAASLVVYNAQQSLTTLRNEKKACDQVKVLGDANLPESCGTVEARITDAEVVFNEALEQRNAI